MSKINWDAIRSGSAFWERWNTTTIFLGCLAIAFGFRLYGFHAVKILNNDTLYYLEQVSVIQNAGVWQGIRDIIHDSARSPFYPLMIHMLDTVLKDPLASAMGVSFIFGLLCVVPFFVLAFRLADRRHALLAVLLVAVNSYYIRYSILVVRETAALFFCLSAGAVVLVPGLSKVLRGCLFGLLVACAALLRPEYIVFYMVTAIAYIAVKGHWRWVFLIAGVGSAFILLSYLCDHHPVFGLFHRLIGSRVAFQLSKVLGTGSILVGILLIVGKGFLAFLHFLSDTMALMNPLAGVLSLLGVASFMRRWRDVSNFQRLLIVAVFSSLLIYSAWAALGDTFTKRWMILTASLLFLFVGYGIEAVGNRFPAHRNWIAVVMVALLLSSTVIHTLTYQVGGKRVGLKQAGAYISREWQRPSRPVILTDEPIVALYARGEVLRYNMEDLSVSLGFLTNAARPDYLIVKEVDGDPALPDIAPLIDKGILVRAAAFPYGSRHGKSRHLGVYETRF
ncbi:MAG: hypothetical protein JRF65_01230 [Deltaproteobacteria bacterium]|nr:hypothetical protein [Deltaproteobacteria bacterium]